MKPGATIDFLSGSVCVVAVFDSRLTHDGVCLEYYVFEIIENQFKRVRSKVILYTPLRQGFEVQWNLVEVLGTMKITLLYQGKKTKNYKELGPGKLPCYNRVLLYI